jgi:hemerythrin-like domain-containing protein
VRPEDFGPWIPGMCGAFGSTTEAETIAKLQAENADMQRQIYELRDYVEQLIEGRDRTVKALRDVLREYIETYFPDCRKHAALEDRARALLEGK